MERRISTPIMTFKPELGDECFVAAFGRMPTTHDDSMFVGVTIGVANARQLHWYEDY